MFPTEQVALGWNALTDVRNHVGLALAAFTALEGRLGGFQDSIANVALIPEDVYRAGAAAAVVIVTAMVPAQGPAPAVPAVTRGITPVEAGQIGMMWRIAQRVFWTRSGNTWVSFQDYDVMVPQAQRNIAQGIVQGAQPQQAPPAGTRFKMNTVVDQGDDSEFAAPTQAEQQSWDANYFTQAQAPPPEHETPTEIQVKGLDVRIVSGRTPYVDFGIWGPYGRLRMRASKFRNWYPAGDGSYIQKEMQGPENFQVYSGIWRVYAVALKMLRAVQQWALDLYFGKIEKLCTLWPTAWHLIYTADDSMRAEHMERIRRRIVTAIAANPINTPANWDAAKPWSVVFAEAAKDTVFWQEHVESRAASWLAHGGRGAPKPLEAEYAARMVPGGQQALEPVYEGTPQRGNKRTTGAPGGGRTAKKAKSRKSQVRRLQDQVAAGGGGGGSSSSQQQQKPGKKKGGGKGVDSESACFGFSKNYGPCKGKAPGSACDGGRTHKCHGCGGPHIWANCSKNKGMKKEEPS
jgi:hypothetical protein